MARRCFPTENRVPASKIRPRFECGGSWTVTNNLGVIRLNSRVLHLRPYVWILSPPRGECSLRQYLFRESKPYPRRQSLSAPTLARAFWWIHSNHLLPTPLQSRDFSACCVKQGDPVPQRVLMETYNIFRSKASCPVGDQSLKKKLAL